MSGGSYDYLYLKLQNEQWNDAIEELSNMEKRLRAAGYTMPADRLSKFVSVYEMTDKMLSNRASDIIDLTKIVEWVDSYDYGIEDLEDWIAENSNEVRHGNTIANKV